MTANNGQRPPIDEEVFLTAAKSTLDDGADRLDAETCSRLAQIRSQAVEAAAKQPTAVHSRRWLMPVGGGLAAAAALLLAVALGPGPEQQPGQLQPQEPMAVLEDIQILTDPEDIEFYQNLEFYEWLATREQDVS